MLAQVVLAPTKRLEITMETVPLAFLPYDGFEVVAAIVIGAMLLLASKLGLREMIGNIVPAMIVAGTVTLVGMSIFGVIPG
jgi:hypothetical protein